MTEALPIDPPLPERFFVRRRHDLRPIEEIEAWWDKPFALCQGERYIVYCLDGRDPQSPTCYGVADSQEQARAIARHALQWWASQRLKPVLEHFDDEGLFGVLVRPQRPWDDVVLLEEFETEPEARRFLASLY